MKQNLKNIIFFFLIFFLNTYNLNANNIAVFNINNIYENNKNFQKFIMKINEIKKKELDSYEEQKNSIINLKLKIDSDSLLLEQNEINKLYNDYNNKITKFNNDINNIEIKYNKIIKYNEEILINSLINIVKELAEIRNLDLIFTEKNYFMISDKLDITNDINKKLNEKNLKFELNPN